jgi:hypothetical protein
VDGDVTRYAVWCRWTALAGPVPFERDKEWNLVKLVWGRDDNLWGYASAEEAESAAERFRGNWQPGYMETYVSAVELPA